MENPNPWQPITHPLTLTYLGKLAEESAELSQILCRIIIQGIDESEPVTGKVNRRALEEEIADVMANISLVVEFLNLNENAIWNRRGVKMKFLKRWHDMLPGDSDSNYYDCPGDSDSNYYDCPGCGEPLRVSELCISCGGSYCPVCFSDHDCPGPHR